jgi:hypothetical protein
MNPLKIGVYLFALASMVFFACNPEGVDPNEKFDEAAVKEIVQAQESFSDVLTVGDAAMDEKGVKKTSDLCANINLDLPNKSLLIDFGATGCTGIDGKTRSGSILIKLEGKFWEPGAQYIYTLTDYTVDGTEIDGTLTLTGFDRDSLGRLFYALSVADGEVNYPDGSFITYETERTYTWIAGEGSGTPDDNVFEVRGFANGQTSTGAGYDAETLAGLEYKTACAYQDIHYPVAGELKIIRNNVSAPYLIDYGSGVCDKDIVVDWNGQSYDVTLP